MAYCALTDRCEQEGIDAAQAAIDFDRRLGRLDHLCYDGLATLFLG